MINALTIDIEDYFHVTAFERHIKPDEWDTYPLRVEGNTMRILDMLDEYAIQATFFVLGWVAARVPALVKEIQHRGHEIACHGYAHQLVYRLTPEEFRQDVFRAKNILENICGAPVYGYRAPSYSITSKSLWALDILVEQGFTYDSSIFPINHDIYGIPGGKRFPHEISTAAGKLHEFPLSTFPLKAGSWNARFPIAGGGYLRLIPAALVARAIRSINTTENQPVIVYFHPWEIDPQQPRIKAGLKSCFRHYLNLERMELKIRLLLDNFRFSTAQEVLSRRALPAPNPLNQDVMQYAPTAAI
jgi:polysaccharide deacetylase family protein (PEP-CTERM system associated)